MVDFNKINKVNKMKSEQKALWDDIPNEETELDTKERSFVEWVPGKPNVLYHEDDGFHVGMNKFQKKTYYFNVKNDDGEYQVLSVTSTRLMIKLKKLMPIGGKVLRYERIGTGYDTDYRVDDV